jgi:hypothetical protein
MSSVLTRNSSQAMAANRAASAIPNGCQPRAPGGLPSITRARTIAKVSMVAGSSAGAVSSGTRR